MSFAEHRIAERVAIARQLVEAGKTAPREEIPGLVRAIKVLRDRNLEEANHFAQLAYELRKASR